jgi:hypothetical protein
MNLAEVINSDLLHLSRRCELGLHHLHPFFNISFNHHFNALLPLLVSTLAFFFLKLFWFLSLVLDLS